MTTRSHTQDSHALIHKPMLTTPAIVLRRRPLTETSLLVDWLTRDEGRLRTVARGALGGSAKCKSAFAPDLFELCEIRVAPSRRSDLHTLAECVLIEPFARIRKDYQKTLCAAYFAALVTRCLPEHSPVPDVHNLVVRALGFLDNQLPTARAVKHFESELLGILGLAPDPRYGILGTLSSYCGGLPPQRSKLTCLASTEAA